MRLERRAGFRPRLDTDDNEHWHVSDPMPKIYRRSTPSKSPYSPRVKKKGPPGRERHSGRRITRLFSPNAAGREKPACTLFLICSRWYHQGQVEATLFRNCRSSSALTNA